MWFFQEDGPLLFKGRGNIGETLRKTGYCDCCVITGVWITGGELGSAQF